MSSSGPVDSNPLATSELKSGKKKRKKGGKAKANVDGEQSHTSETENLVPAQSSETQNKESDVDETSTPDTNTQSLTNGTRQTNLDQDTQPDPDARFNILVKERDALRAEVTQSRESLEQLQAKHDASLEAIRQELADAQGEKENAEEQYQTLLGKVTTIKAQLGERLKADAEDLAQARTRIEELEQQSADHTEKESDQNTKIESLTAELAAQSKELSLLRNRSNLSQQNWLKEREEILEQEAHTREQFDNAEQAMREWEVLALEERSVRKDLGDRVNDLEDQLTQLQHAHDRASNERDTQSNAVDGLQKALQEIQTARKKELREVVESSHAEAEKLRHQLSEAQQTSSTMGVELATAKSDLERVLPFEKEVKEKNLLIGKLRHEAVTLNEHLTKALRFLKKGRPDDNVDRQIVTNHFLHFLALERSDPKKFQILQLIAALLNWNDAQREQAGLSRPGTTSNLAPLSVSTSTSTSSLRLPTSPFVHRTPSTSALTLEGLAAGDGGPAMGSPGGRSRESLAELWQGFLEQESAGAEAGAGVGVEGKGGEKGGAGS